MRLITFLISLFFLLPGSRVSGINHQNVHLIPSSSVSLPKQSEVMLPASAAHHHLIEAPHAPDQNGVYFFEDSEDDDDKQCFTRKLKALSSFLNGDYRRSSIKVARLQDAAPDLWQTDPLYLVLRVFRLWSYNSHVCCNCNPHHVESSICWMNALRRSPAILFAIK